MDHSDGWARMVGQKWRATMRLTPFGLTAATLCALAACNRSSPPNASAGASPNAAAPAAPAAPAGGNVTAAAAPADGLWGVAEEEDAASHRGVDFIAFNRSGRTVTALAIRPDEGEPGV